MPTEDCDIVWAEAGEETKAILEHFKECLEINTRVGLAVDRIYYRLYDGQGWSDADCALVGEWLDEMTSGFYDCEFVDPNTGETVAQGTWIAVDARDYKAQLVGKEVAPYV